MKKNTKKTPYGKRHFALYAGILAAALAAMFLIRQCTLDRRSPYGRASGHSGGDTIDIAIEVSPLLYSLASDTVEGLDYEMLRDFSRQTGRPIKFHPFTSIGKALEGLEKGRYDIAVSTLPSTIEMKGRYTMTKPLYIDRQVLVQRRMPGDSLPPIVSQHQLAGDTVWLPEGSPFLTRVRLLSHEIGDTIYVEQLKQFSSEQLFILVAVGELPRAVVNESVAKLMEKNYPDADISTAMSFAQFQTWALRDDSAILANDINTWLAGYKESNRYEQLTHKYLEGSNLHNCTKNIQSSTDVVKEGSETDSLLTKQL